MSFDGLKSFCVIDLKCVQFQTKNTIHLSHQFRRQIRHESLLIMPYMRSLGTTFWDLDHSKLNRHKGKTDWGNTALSIFRRVYGKVFDGFPYPCIEIFSALYLFVAQYG